ncbi:DUF6232 family protein [Kangiella sp. TOML190]|uniref:DUF6232 family protein n=1 Tax=Kangiella sp. TOML190 TaxID=2931351 RepID=UPI00203D75AE|nr:DUF6232 family protein [Kangiella sp. TOML190]
MTESNQESVFLNEDGVRVTNARFILPKQTFAMSGITSVQSSEEKPSRVGPIVFIIIGVLLFSGKGDLIAGGIICLVLGIGWFFLQKPTFHVLL